ncbi:PTS sugar transporter subunit IIA [Acidithiobacillus sp.]
MAALEIPVTAIRLDAPVRTGAEALAALAELLAPAAGRPAAQITQALQERERQGSTGIGHGVALPHARLEGITEVVIAALRSAKGLPFAAPDGEDVQLLIAVLVPRNAPTIHLETLSTLAARLADAGLREKLRNTGDAADFQQQLTGVPVG